jgi:hypothetical protein
MRLFDRVASGQEIRTLDGKTLSGESQANVRKHAHEGIRVIADEAAQHFWQSGQTQWDLEHQDFGSIRPPFDVTWIEWITPHNVLDADGWKKTSSNPCAMFVVTVSGTDGLHLVVQGLTWDFGADCVVMYPVASIIKIDPAGMVVGHEFYCDTNFIDQGAALSDITSQQYATSLYQLLFPGFLALGWMNCKNIHLVSGQPNERVSRKRQRRGQFAGLSYQRIVIDGVAGNATRSNREAEATGKRLHMVRGHFATYTDERPLFGRVTGTFWRAWHVRGDADLGRINHEYHIEGCR